MGDAPPALPDEKGKLPKVDENLLKAAEVGDVVEIEKVLKVNEKAQDEQLNKKAANRIIVSLIKEEPIKGIFCSDVRITTP